MRAVLYLPASMANTLRLFGDLSDVVNRILDAGFNGDTGILDCPECGDRHGCAQYVVNVTNEEYLELVANYGRSNTRISLRRIIYDFVNNERYIDLGWKMTKQAMARFEHCDANNCFRTVLEKLNKISALNNDNNYITTEINRICKEVTDLKDYMNGKEYSVQGDSEDT